MYKGKDFGTPFKKRGCDPLSCAKFQLRVGTSMRLLRSGAEGAAQPVVVCDILSHVTEKAARSAAATYCRIDNYLLDSPPKGGCDILSH